MIWPCIAFTITWHTKRPFCWTAMGFSDIRSSFCKLCDHAHGRPWSISVILVLSVWVGWQCDSNVSVVHALTESSFSFHHLLQSLVHLSVTPSQSHTPFGQCPLHGSWSIRRFSLFVWRNGRKTRNVVLLLLEGSRCCWPFVGPALLGSAPPPAALD